MKAVVANHFAISEQKRRLMIFHKGILGYSAQKDHVKSELTFELAVSGQELRLNIPLCRN